MATVHLLCGLPGSGKTTVARRLEAAHGAIRFTLDEWMLRLHDLTPYDSEYGARAERVRELVWSLVEELVDRGHDVVLDWSLWSCAARADAAARARALRADVLLHHVDVPLAVCEQRLVERNAALPDGAHRIDLEDLRRFAVGLFEPPGEQEGLPIAVER